MNYSTMPQETNEPLPSSREVTVKLRLKVILGAAAFAFLRGVQSDSLHAIAATTRRRRHAADAPTLPRGSRVTTNQSCAGPS